MSDATGGTGTSHHSNPDSAQLSGSSAVDICSNLDVRLVLQKYCSEAPVEQASSENEEIVKLQDVDEWFEEEVRNADKLQYMLSYLEDMEEDSDERIEFESRTASAVGLLLVVVRRSESRCFATLT